MCVDWLSFHFVSHCFSSSMTLVLFLMIIRLYVLFFSGDILLCYLLCNVFVVMYIIFITMLCYIIYYYICCHCAVMYLSQYVHLSYIPYYIFILLSVFRFISPIFNVHTLQQHLIY